MVRKRQTARIPVKPRNGTPPQYVRGRCRFASEEYVAVTILDDPALTLWAGRIDWKMCGIANMVLAVVLPLVLTENDFEGAEPPGDCVEYFLASILQ